MQLVLLVARVRLDRKDLQVRLVQQVLLVPQEIQVLQALQGLQALQVQCLDLQVQLGHKGPQGQQERQEQQVLQVQQVLLALLVLLVPLAALVLSDQLARLEQRVQRDLLAQQDLREHLEPLDLLVQPEQQEQAQRRCLIS